MMMHAQNKNLLSKVRNVVLMILLLLTVAKEAIYQIIHLSGFVKGLYVVNSSITHLPYRWSVGEGDDVDNMLQLSLWWLLLLFAAVKLSRSGSAKIRIK